MLDQAVACKLPVTRVLIVEDDPASAAFLQSALEALPVQIAGAATLAEALAAASADLYLIDANLPDGSGAQLLDELRRRHGQVAALAHTADAGAGTRTALLAAGFATVLVKPLAATDLQNAVRFALRQQALAQTTPTDTADIPGIDAPLWDDAAALRVLGGKTEAMNNLRLLFLRSLPEQLALLSSAARDRDAATLHHHLHRFKASCGFVGAPRLQALTHAFDAALPEVALFDAFAETARLTQQSNPVPPDLTL